MIEYPGVFVEEVPAGPRTIAGVSTSTTAFVGLAAAGPVGEPQRVRSWTDYERLFGGLDGREMGYAVLSFFENGGTDAWVMRLEEAGGVAALAGSGALDALPAVNLLCLPDLAGLYGDGHRQVAAAAAAWCVARRAFLILDPPEALADVEAAATWVAGISSLLGDPDRSHAAAYWPRPIVADPLNGGQRRAIASSGAVAGAYARTDSERGVWKAPAGIDQGHLRGVLGFEHFLNDAASARLNPLALNALRSFSAGPVIWGARTLAGADAAASEYKYVPVRRLALFIEESLHAGLRYAAFEPNGAPLWAAMRLAGGAFMNTLFSQGAFQGQTPAEAYFVKCDATTTTPDDLEAGMVRLLVGFAPLEPAEFITLSLDLAAGAPA
jgi:phage tail sheath protein FI